MLTIFKIMLKPPSQTIKGLTIAFWEYEYEAFSTPFSTNPVLYTTNKALPTNLFVGFHYLLGYKNRCPFLHAYIITHLYYITCSMFSVIHGVHRSLLISHIHQCSHNIVTDWLRRRDKTRHIHQQIIS